MKVQVLTVKDCPNASATLARVAAALADEGLTAEVSVVEIATAAEAQSWRFLGSPAVHVDGADIEAARRGDRHYSVACRVYRSDTGLAGTPPQEMIRAALRAASAREALSGVETTPPVQGPRDRS